MRAVEQRGMIPVCALDVLAVAPHLFKRVSHTHAHATHALARKCHETTVGSTNRPSRHETGTGASLHRGILRWSCIATRTVAADRPVYGSRWNAICRQQCGKLRHRCAERDSAVRLCRAHITSGSVGPVGTGGMPIALKLRGGQACP